MRLHRLEISGFKSFPDRSELAFDTGVTAIVGPNGCGKSNVVDAITWVLGEQSAKTLRGDRMEDVIFSGSDARKPTASAEVRLRFSSVRVKKPFEGPREDARIGTGPGNGNGSGNGHAHGGDHGHRLEAASAAGVAVLDDEDAWIRDVEVARRLYRSGESEYLIDGEVCRLRDIQDLLMDAGLGVRAYAVIEQGKIGQILTSRPTERRQLIEEAAGITKYKSRRRAAELKLEAAQQNLARVEDIVFEVERQRGALKRQAAKARRFRRLRDELRRWEKVLIARRHRELAAALEAGRRRLEEVKASEAAAAGRVAALEAELARLRAELATAESQGARVRDLVHAHQLEIGRRQQKLEFDRQQHAAGREAAQALERELEALRARQAPAAEELESRRIGAAQAIVARDEALLVVRTADRAAAAFQAETEGFEADVEAARSEVFAAMTAAATLRHVVEHASAARERLVDELNKLDVEALDLQREREAVEEGRRDAAASAKRIAETLEGLRTTKAARESELATCRIEREWRERELRAREHEIAGLTARLRSLEQLDAARAGYEDGARLILSRSDESVAHVGSVADHLEVAPGLERAVEASLADMLQCVVVPSVANATEGMRIVREHEAGRCAFLVLDRAAPAEAAGGARMSLRGVEESVSVTGPGADRIKATLNGRWIADSLEDALDAASRTAAPVATLAGELVRHGAIVEGGAGEARLGILGTRREIRDLRERVASDSAVQARLASEVSALDLSIARSEAAVATLTAEQHRQEKALFGVELQLTRFTEEDVRLDRRASLLSSERARAESELAALEDRQREALGSMGRIESEQRSADERLTVAQRALLEGRDRLAGLMTAAADAKAHHATLVERAAAVASEVERLSRAGAELAERIVARNEDLSRLERGTADLEASMAENARALDENVRACEEVESQLRTVEESVAQLQAAYALGESSIRDARQALETEREEATRLQVAVATAESDVTHLAATCLETLQETLDEVLAQVEADAAGTSAGSPSIPAVPVDDADEEADAAGESTPGAGRVAATPEEAVAELRAKIDRLGPVNMMAVEQFEELESRHAFLTTQRQDLLDAIASTSEAIRRMDRTSRERFREAFDAIDANFSATFTTLFGGGRAGLVLLDENDLLESGVDIIAQPPGKRLQNVQLLSGGEKALTAMALMFAIFKYRPSPFCLLDEIDAPLDDANIGRFIEMLKGMQDHTQFVLITHNRKTMEIADRLYGVTMEEPGVSKLISVQMN